MWQLAAELWHGLPESEILEWERAGTRRGMTGFAWYMSQALRPNPGIYLPLAGGTMTGAVDFNGQYVHGLPAPIHVNDAARKAYVDNQVVTRSLLVPNPAYDRILDIDSDDPAIGWTTIDVSALVDASAVMAILQFRFLVNVCGTAGTNHLALRRQALDGAIYIVVVWHNEPDPTDKRGLALCPLSAARTFQYTIGEATAASGFAIDLNLQGWINTG